MSSNPLILQCSPSEGGNPQVVVDALIPQIIMSGAAAIAQQAVDLAKENIAILGGALATAGLAILLPSLIVVIVNAIGFTAAGVLKGALLGLLKWPFKAIIYLFTCSISCGQYSVWSVWCMDNWHLLRTPGVWGYSCGCTSCYTSSGGDVSCCWCWPGGFVYLN